MFEVDVTVADSKYRKSQKTPHLLISFLIFQMFVYILFHIPGSFPRLSCHSVSTFWFLVAFITF